MDADSSEGVGFWGGGGIIIGRQSRCIGTGVCSEDEAGC